MISRRKFIAAASISTFAARLPAQQPVTLHIAAAADLQPVMPAFAAAYEKETGTKLQVSFGSSSVLATQILNGSPVDVFLGADFSFPEKIVAAGMADQAMAQPYAQGTLVLWARKDSALKPLTLDLLTDPRVTRVAIADQFHAPYGFVAYEALRLLKLEDKVKSKLVVAENVAQTAQFVDTGNAQLGFISQTLAVSPHFKETGEFILVPKIYPKLRQCGVTLKRSAHPAEAKHFLAWLTSSKVQSHLAEFGLEPVA